MCEECIKYEAYILDFVNGYGDKYSYQAIESLNRTRQELCNLKAQCICEKCKADDLIKIIDNDPIIRKKKGL